MKKIGVILFSILLISTALLAKDTKKTEKDYLADLNSAKQEKVIVTAAYWLGENKKKVAIDKLIALLSDERVNVRISVVASLGYMGEEKAVDALNKVILSDESPDVRYTAILATFRIGSKKSLETWKKAGKTEKDPFIRDFLKKMEEKAKGK